MSSRETAQAVGAAQIRSLAEALDIVLADGKRQRRLLTAGQGLTGGYPRPPALRPRVLSPCAAPSGQRGHPRKHGARFAFKDAQTWGEPEEVQEFVHERYGKVKVQLWHGQHDKRAPELTCTLLRAQVHREKAEPLQPVWFLWLPPVQPPASVSVSTKTLGEAYVNRWPVELGLRFRSARKTWVGRYVSKARRLVTPGPLLVALAHWMLFLTCPLVKDCPLPWQKTQPALTPQRLRQSLWTIFTQIGTSARPPKLRGKSPGWPKGKARTPKEQHKAVKKGVLAAQTA